MNRFFLFCLPLCVLVSCNTPDLPEETLFSSLSGAYFGQQTPSDSLELFAPGIISTSAAEFSPSFSWNGKQCFFYSSLDDKDFLFYSYEKDEKWTLPKILPFSENFNIRDPFLSSNGNGLYFASNKAGGKSSDLVGDYNIWYSYKTLAGWEYPSLIDSINSAVDETAPSITRKGTIYFTRKSKDSGRYAIWRSVFKEGSFEETTLLPNEINSDNAFDACIAPDESYILFCSDRDGSLGGSDIYVSFYEDEQWSEAVSIGSRFNTPGDETSVRITPGGKYVFYSSNGNPLNIAKAKNEPPQSASHNEIVYFTDVVNASALLPSDSMADIYWFPARLLKSFR